MDKKITNSQSGKYLKYGVATLLVIGVTVLAHGYTQSSNAVRIQHIDKGKVTINTVQQGAFVDALSLRAQVVPQTTIYLDTIAGGQVEARLVEQGEYVQKGQPLVHLSNTNLQLDVMSREAQVTEQLNFLRNTQMNMATTQLNLRRDLLEIELQINHLTRRFKQSSALVEKGLLAQDKLSEIQSDLTYYKARKELTLERQIQESSIRKLQVEQLEDSAIMLQKNLKFARKNLDKLLLKAPMAGYLSELDVEIGESKARGARLGQIDIPDEYKLVARLDEFYLSKVQLGMQVVVQLGERNLSVQVSKIDSRVSQSQFHIEMDLPDGLDDIKRGQSIDIELMLGGNKAHAVLLNRGAFFASSGGNWVYVLSHNGDYALRRAVMLGKKNQNYFEVISGLEVGERVITSSYGSFDKSQRLHFN